MSSNIVPIKENVYLVLLKYFDGKIENIDKKTLKDLNKQTFNDKEIDVVDKKAINVLTKILKMKKHDQKRYASAEWKYPDWNSETKKIKLKEAFPESESETETDPEMDFEEGNLIEIKDLSILFKKVL